MLIIRGVNLFHTQVEEIIHQFDFLSPNYRLIIERKGTMDTVSVEVEHEPGLQTNEQIVEIIKRKIKDTIGITMDIDLKGPGSIPRSQGGKLNRILDKR